MRFLVVTRPTNKFVVGWPTPSFRPASLNGEDAMGTIRHPSEVDTQEREVLYNR